MLDFENQTPKGISERAESDVKLAAPRSNPTRKNSFLNALIKAFSFRIYDFYQNLKRLKNESFPDTSSYDGELRRWGNYKKINPNPESGAKGDVIVTGEDGKTLPSGATFTINQITYQTTQDADISNITVNLISLTRNGDTVTAKAASTLSLATGVNVTISGANEDIFNGVYQINMVDAVTFTYQVDGDDLFQSATGLIKASFLAAVVNAEVSTESSRSGDASNQKSGTTINLDKSYDGIDGQVTVSFSGLSGGADEESPEAYRRRVLFAYQNPIALFNKAAITTQITSTVKNATRVWVKECTPEIGQVTIYFTTDNRGVIPTNQDVVDVRASVESIKPSNTRNEDIYVYAPNPHYVDFDFVELTPNTVAMRSAIQQRLAELFYTSAEVGKPMTSEDYRSKISNTVDDSGTKVQLFALREPVGDIDPGTGGIPILRNVVFSGNSGAIYMANLFDGSNGGSDGTADGYSRDITGSNQTVDINVYGTFDNAVVTLQMYGNADSQWHDTSAVWNESDKFQGLTIKAGERYRLNITNSGALTNISAEAFYG